MDRARANPPSARWRWRPAQCGPRARWLRFARSVTARLSVCADAFTPIETGYACAASACCTRTQCSSTWKEQAISQPERLQARHERRRRHTPMQRMHPAAERLGAGYLVGGQIVLGLEYDLDLFRRFLDERGQLVVGKLRQDSGCGGAPSRSRAAASSSSGSTCAGRSGLCTPRVRGQADRIGQADVPTRQSAASIALTHATQAPVAGKSGRRAGASASSVRGPFMPGMSMSHSTRSTWQSWRR